MRNTACVVDSDGTMSIDLSCSVNDVVQRCPDSLPVFAAYGLDTCCRGNLSVREAALDAGVDPAMIADALEATLAESRPVITPIATTPRTSCGCAT
jgi:iron-sulfur cluster repair protein YtfE (RIC family)